MNKEWKSKWLDALRSGKYSQTRAVLRCPEGFCCLGVLCDISGIGKWVKAEDHNRKAEFYRIPNGVYSFTSLPDEVEELTGITTTKEEIVINKLVSMNDAGKTFEEIAEVIEAEL